MDEIKSVILENIWKLQIYSLKQIPFKFIFLVLLLLILFYNGFGQNTVYPRGGYINIQEIQTKTPSITDSFRISLRKPNDIIKRGGNDYEADYKKDHVGKWRKENKIYAISTGEHLFLNCAQINLPQGFTNVLDEGPFLLFECATPRAKKHKQTTLAGPGSANTTILGVGMSVKTIDDAKLLRKKIFYCLETNTGEV
ncbi:MAG TPA: DUF6563 family protein, partial [Bacteroidia bacterium]|nr:DUF6563 family protein [Bacteroidia bacterium]